MACQLNGAGTPADPKEGERASDPQRHDELIAQCREMVQEVRAHEHPYREDFYCLNHVSYMGERMAFVLGHIEAIEGERDEARAEVARLRAELSEAENDHWRKMGAGGCDAPADPKGYCPC